MFYVYEWFIINTNEVFYVGKGSKRRHSSKKSGNKLFYEIISANRCNYRVIKEFELEEEAFQFEKERITELKLIGQAKCNYSIGGSGGYSKVWTSEKRKEKSTNNPMKRPDQKERMSKFNPMKNKEISEKVNSQKRKSIIVDGEEFNSLQSAANFYNVSPTAVLYWLKTGHKNKIPCYYKGREPKQLTFTEEKSFYKPIIVNNIRYISVKAAAKALNINYIVFHKKVKHNKPIKGLIYSYDNQKPSD